MEYVETIASFARRAFAARSGARAAPPAAGRARAGHGRKVDRADMQRLLMDELSSLPPLLS